MFSKDPFFRGFDEYFDNMHEEMEKMMNQFVRGFDEKKLIDLANDPNTKVYGFSMRIGPDGKPIICEFGNMKPDTSLLNQKNNKTQELRRPLIDVMEDNNTVTIIAEIPGVEKNEILLDGNKDRLNLEVKNKQRPYKTNIVLPCEVIHEKARANYKNGVLSITIPKKKLEYNNKKIDIN